MSATPAPISRQAWSVLAVSTLAFTVCFMVWMMFAVIGIPIRKSLGLNESEGEGWAALPLSSEASLSVVPQFRVVMLRPPLPRMASPALLSSKPPAQCR